MDPMTMAALGSMVVGGVGQALGQASANAANLKIAREQMSFQERMSNTAWQRGVADMRAAGVNPLLAVSSGPASSAQGASAQMGNVAGGLSDTIRSGISSAIGVNRAKAELGLLKAQQDKTLAEAQKAQTENINEQAIGYYLGAGMVDKDSSWEGRRRALANDLLAAQAGSARATRDYTLSGIPEREARGSLFGIAKPLTDAAGRGWRQLTPMLERWDPLWLQRRLYNSARSLVR